MHHRYQIVLYLDGKKLMYLHKGNSYKHVRKKYKQFLLKEQPSFCIQYKKNKRVNFHIGFVSYNEKVRKVVYSKDFLGRNVTMSIPDDQSLLFLKPYWLEEVIYDHQKKDHIYLNEFFRNLDKSKGVKMVYKLNRYIIIENETEPIQIYSLKNLNDSERFIEIIMDKRFEDGKLDCVFSKDVDTAHRKYLYERLIAIGVSKAMLYKHYSR